MFNRWWPPELQSSRILFRGVVAGCPSIRPISLFGVPLLHSSEDGLWKTLMCLRLQGLASALHWPFRMCRLLCNKLQLQLAVPKLWTKNRLLVRSLLVVNGGVKTFGIQFKILASARDPRLPTCRVAMIDIECGALDSGASAPALI